MIEIIILLLPLNMPSQDGRSPVWPDWTRLAGRPQLIIQSMQKNKIIYLGVVKEALHSQSTVKDQNIYLNRGKQPLYTLSLHSVKQ